MRDFVARGGRWVVAHAALLTSLVVLAAIRPVPISYYESYRAQVTRRIVAGVL